MMAPLWSWQPEGETIVVRRAPLNGWLVLLAAGWRLVNPLESWHVGHGHDGAYSVRLWRAGA